MEQKAGPITAGLRAGAAGRLGRWRLRLGAGPATPPEGAAAGRGLSHAPAAARRARGEEEGEEGRGGAGEGREERGK